jgi:hypothetical protein
MTGIVKALRGGARAAWRDFMLQQIDRVLDSLFDPEIDVYTVRDTSGQAFQVEPAAFRAMVEAVRTRFRSALR